MKIIKAVAGVLCRGNMVLMASRPAGKPYAGFWEFPGGKLEESELTTYALIRELKEEIGVVVQPNDCTYFTAIEQQYKNEYEEYTVKLDVMLVKDWLQEPIGLEDQTLHWHDIRESCSLNPLLITTQKILELLKTSLLKG
jgi:8-oxo-dGTP diphosphatase